jgi:hypothetical protein
MVDARWNMWGGEREAASVTGELARWIHVVGGCHQVLGDRGENGGV